MEFGVSLCFLYQGVVLLIAEPGIAVLGGKSVLPQRDLTLRLAPAARFRPVRKAQARRPAQKISAPARR